MELRLLIVGAAAFIYAKLAKYLKKKKLLENKNIFAAFSAAFALLAAFMFYYLANFMMANGISGGFGARRTALLAAAAAVWAGFNIYRAKNSKEKTAQKIYASHLDWAETVYFAGFFAAAAMFLFVQAFKIPSASMRNTLLEGDNLFVNKITYGVKEPFTGSRLIKFNDIKRGDVIVFKFPAEDREQINCGEPQYGRDFVKRVIALPGEKVEIKNKQVFINDELMPAQDYEVYDSHERVEYDLPVTPEEYQHLWEARELENMAGLYLRDYFGPV
ncbi:MAG: signal peptidase I, partial [Elusimicrobiota bacterium]|nr:signal peptidase I [Elusimicrobiota bacterium]